MKRGLALLFAVAMLAAAYAVAHAVEANRARTVRLEAARVAESSGMRATDALTTHVRELKLEAQNAAANPRLVAALRGNADAATLQDLFRTEEWWEPYRNAFKVYAVAFEGDKLDVIEGMRNADFASDLLVREAREGHEAVAQIVMGKGWPFAAAAANIELPGKSIPAVLLLARPIDDAAIRKLAEKARGPVLLSDGARAVLEAGSETERELLHAAIGAETRAPIYQAADGTWAAAVSSVVPGLWLWSFGGGAAAAHDAESTAVATTAIVWSVAGVLALGGLVFGLRRPNDGDEPDPRAADGGEDEGAERRPLTEAGSPAFRTRHGLGDPKGQLPGSMGRGMASGGVSGDAATDYHGTAGAIPRSGSTTTFGRYLLLDLLGEGGMAQVFTAVTFGAEGFRRTFVVKRLRAELSRDPAVVAQFIDEAKLGSTLVHSNVIPVFDFGKVGDEYYLAQEYILGRDMGRVTARALERQRPASVATILYMTAQTLLALEYAHSKLGDGGRPMAIVHRDVSPSNILLSARGEVKLFDFGIVKAEGRVTKTQHGVVKGNVSFMSPEQARGTNVDGRADLFSLGLVIYYCLTGEVLYRGETTYELLVKAATGPGPDELGRIAALPAPSAAIVGKALEVDPAKRYQTAAEFAAAVLPHTAGGAAAAAAMMAALFSDDFRAEEARFAAALPQGEGATGLDGGTGVQNRRT